MPGSSPELRPHEKGEGLWTRFPGRDADADDVGRRKWGRHLAALRWAGDLSRVFLAPSAGLIAFGLINAASVAGGTWFGRLRWPTKQSAVAHPCINA